MKRLLFLFISIAIVTIAKSQRVDSLTLSKLKLNFAVPDMPAFKSLGTESSDLLRPSTVQALAITTSEFYQDRKLLLPQAFAMEISPSLLINAKKGPVELRKYAKRAVLNSLRFSLGSSKDSSLSPSGRNLSFGLRISLIDKGDLTTDTSYQASLSVALERFRKNVSNVSLKEFAISKNIDITGDAWEDLIVSDKKLKAEFDVYLANEEEESQKVFLEELAKLKEDYRKKYWNATKLDFAAAILSSSPDSLVKNIRFNRAELWLTWAQKVGENGQFLLGANAKTVKNLLDTVKATQNNSYFNLSIPARYLLGTNRVKGFVEGQYSYIGELKENKFLLNLGAELNIIDGVWVNVYGGLDYNKSVGSTTFVTNFNLKLTLPENFNFF